jgi:hypothetical protein
MYSQEVTDDMRFQVLTLLTVLSCSLVHAYQHFTGTCCFCHQIDEMRSSTQMMAAGQVFHVSVSNLKHAI